MSFCFLTSSRPAEQDALRQGSFDSQRSPRSLLVLPSLAPRQPWLSVEDPIPGASTEITVMPRSHGLQDFGKSGILRLQCPRTEVQAVSIQTATGAQHAFFKSRVPFDLQPETWGLTMLPRAREPSGEPHVRAANLEP